jgi:hypothetical protein
MPPTRIPAMSGIGHGDLRSGCGVKSWRSGPPSRPLRTYTMMRGFRLFTIVATALVRYAVPASLGRLRSRNERAGARPAPSPYQRQCRTP